VTLLEKIGRYRARPGAQAADSQYLARVGAIDHDRRHAGDVHQIAVQDAQRNARRDPGVHGIAASLEYDKRGMRGAVMAGDGHVASSRSSGRRLSMPVRGKD
jgi:hypothetical protein